jgi:hypothetical protein
LVDQGTGIELIAELGSGRKSNRPLSFHPGNPKISRFEGRCYRPAPEGWPSQADEKAPDHVILIPQARERDLLFVSFPMRKSPSPDGLRFAP